MADKVQVSGPITVQLTSQEAVAFWLLEKIYSYEAVDEEKTKTREYWLTLYTQCLKATKGYSLESVLEAE